MGCLYGDKGYISGSFKQKLVDKGVILITGVKINMKPKVMKFCDRLILRIRFIIETVFDLLKNISQI
uniref:transposase n=1 Tax=Candidatus Enterovibrio escicola TaxID=1927127 RepID=UPI0018F17829|nr:transposase [Candidatus Enterovibrio escacola]